MAQPAADTGFCLVETCDQTEKEGLFSAQIIHSSSYSFIQQTFVESQPGPRPLTAGIKKCREQQQLKKPLTPYLLEAGEGIIVGQRGRTGKRCRHRCWDGGAGEAVYLGWKGKQSRVGEMGQDTAGMDHRNPELLS
jgi:hypothetical protein